MIDHWSVTSAGAQGPSRPGPVAHRVVLSDGWRFGPVPAQGWDQPGADESALAEVVVPHCVAPLSWRHWDPASWERTFCYRRAFVLPEHFAGMRVFVDFAGAMTKATVHLNGHELGVHLGGYLPFSYEVTDLLAQGENLLAVLLDASFDINVPPNVPAPGTNLDIDYFEPGGIYREVCLRAVPQVFLDDVFAKPVDVLSPSPRVEVECTIDAAVVPAGSGLLSVEVLDPETGARTGSAVMAPEVDQAGRSVVRLSVDQLSEVTLWDIERPKLYDVVTTLVWNGQALHEHRARIGFRHARFELNGFFLNGRRVKLFGANRHQHFPYTGFAMGDRAQRRDAEILRHELNCNMVRCSHYPQAPAFLDACDELGLLVWEEPAGWQYLGDQAWKELACRDVEEMVRRDRNRPCIVIWAPRLNETADDTELYTRTEKIVKDLDDSRQTAGATHGHYYLTQNYQHDVFGYDDYTTYTDGHGRYPFLLPPRPGLPYLISESISWRSSKTRTYTRRDPVAVQQIQAFAHAMAHNKVAGDPAYAGLLAWSGFDYYSTFRFHHETLKVSGIVDIFRIPKPGAAIYRAQVDPRFRPVIEPAFYFDLGPGSPTGPGPGAMVCSNCDRVEAYLDGEHFATLRPDRERFANLAYPPSFFDLTVERGQPELRLDGYLGAHLALSRSFSSSPERDQLALEADDAELVADGVDATRVVFAATDRFGAPRPFVGGEVTFSLDGPGVLIGDNPFAFGDAGGAGAVWARGRAGEAGEIRLQATHERLGTAAVTIVAREAQW
jgi:beta-galactosidase